MKRTLLALAFVTLVATVEPAASVETRVSVGFRYGYPYGCYRPAYVYPVMVHSYPRYRYNRFYRPYYSRAYFVHRPYTRIVVRGCY